MKTIIALTSITCTTNTSVETSALQSYRRAVQRQQQQRIPRATSDRDLFHNRVILTLTFWPRFLSADSDCRGLQICQLWCWRLKKFFCYRKAGGDHRKNFVSNMFKNAVLTQNQHIITTFHLTITLNEIFVWGNRGTPLAKGGGSGPFCILLRGAPA